MHLISSSNNRFLKFLKFLKVLNQIFRFFDFADVDFRKIHVDFFDLNTQIVQTSDLCNSLLSEPILKIFEVLKSSE